MLLSLIQSGLPYDVGSIGVWEYEENQLLQTPAKKGIKSSLDPMPMPLGMSVQTYSPAPSSTSLPGMTRTDQRQACKGGSPAST